MQREVEKSHSARRGVGLLEMALALGISGVLMGGVWQLTSVVGRQTEASRMASHALTVARAASDYLAANKTAILAQLPNFTSSIRVKINSADTGNASLTDLVTAGSLNSTFTNLNSYSQTYALYVARQDAGPAGVDASDRLIGLLLTTGGQTITDQLGSVVAPRLGAGGGFMFSTDNPTTPATTIRGTAGGWAVNLSAAPWSSIGTVATAGHLAVLTNMLASGASGGSGASSIDGLTDGKTDYTGDLNLFMGDHAGDANAGGYSNTAVGIGALQLNTTGDSNTAFGIGTLQSNTTGGSNTAVGLTALGANTEGGVNTALGGWALRSNTMGDGNTAVGWAALNNNTTGSHNTATGDYALAANSTGHHNVAMGPNAMLQNDTGSYNTGMGNNALASSLTANYNTALGYSALQLNKAGSESTAVGYNAMYYGNNSTTPYVTYNTAVGAQALMGNSLTTSGIANTAIGHSALKDITSGSNNTTLGYLAGSNITTENYNIVIGSGVSAPVAGSNAMVNIGNLLYGDITNGRFGIANANSVTTAGISFDAGYVATDSSRLAKGTTAQRPTCSASLEGAQRWNTQTQTLEICTGGTWMQPSLFTPIGGTPPTVPTNSGFFVLTSTPTTGNLGGLTGANAWCLTDLTNNDWMGKATAISRGQLVAAKVKAFLCSAGGTCNGLMPLTTYFFARSGDNTVGGANMTMDSDGKGPNNAISWAAANYFSGTFEYWTQRFSAVQNTWGDNYSGGGCVNFTSASSSDNGRAGMSSATDRSRWYGNSNSCDKSLYLICYVNP